MEPVAFGVEVVRDEVRPALPVRAEHRLTAFHEAPVHRLPVLQDVEERVVRLGNVDVHEPLRRKPRAALRARVPVRAAVVRLVRQHGAEARRAARLVALEPTRRIGRTLRELRTLRQGRRCEQARQRIAVEVAVLEQRRRGRQAPLGHYPLSSES